MYRTGCYSNGIFEKFLSILVGYSQLTSAEVNSRLLFKEAAVVFFGPRRIRVFLRKNIKCITVDVEGQSPISAFETIMDMMHDLLKQGINSLPLYLFLMLTVRCFVCASVCGLCVFGWCVAVVWL